ncbi:hypothetical protein G6F37_012088 [Rhizopus arrhizus]|nr:hypothetical protein G6F38_012121 [Rhizopus arrhizus]KAG1145779.1 hypothetical protein G6F37_012088 [Rhizopus arrhizus]
MKVINQSNIISDPNDSDHKDEEAELMSISPDKEEEEFIDPEELLQLQQDLKVPALELINDTQKHQHNKKKV